jgi:nitronate monooxygenase
LQIEAQGLPFENVAPLVKGIRGRDGLVSGDLDHGVWTAGLVQGLIHDVPSVKELVDRIITEAETLISVKLASLMN